MELTLPDGRTAQYWLGGAGTGPVVLFHHGCPDTRWAAMTGAAAAVEAGARLLCVNRPGYGTSTRAPSTHASVADDVVSVLDRLGVDRVATLGMSVGGAYAVTLAARHPDRVDALGVVATLPMVGADPRPVEELVAAYRPDFEAWVARVRPDDPDDRLLADRWTAELPAQDARLVAAAGPEAVAASAREALADHDGYLRDAALLGRPWPTRTEDVRCPTRLWYGERDVRALPGAEWFGARIPGALLEVRPGATHWATLGAHWSSTLESLLSP